MKAHLAFTTFFLAASISLAAAPANAPAPAAGKAPAASKPATAAPAGDAAGPGVKKPELESIAKELETASISWLKEGMEDISLQNKIKDFKYDEASLKALVEVINSGNRKPPVNIFVAYNLTQGLPLCRPEVLQKGYPGIESACGRLVEYRQFPVLTKAQLDSLKLPDPNMSLEATVRAKAESAKNQQAKAESEKIIKLHNDVAYKLEKTLTKLRLLTGEDQKVFDAATRSEAAGTAAWADILEMVKAEAPNFTEKRAKFYYDRFKGWAGALYNKKAKYKDLNNPKISLMTNSGYEEKELYPGIQIITALNVVKDQAKQPAIPVPTQQDIDAKQQPVKQPTRSTRHH